MLRVDGGVVVAHSHDDSLAEVVVVKTSAIPDGRHAHRRRDLYHKIQLDHPEMMNPG